MRPRKKYLSSLPRQLHGNVLRCIKTEWLSISQKRLQKNGRVSFRGEAGDESGQDISVTLFVDIPYEKPSKGASGVIGYSDRSVRRLEPFLLF